MTNTTPNAQNEQPVPARAHVYNYAVRVTEIATETLEGRENDRPAHFLLHLCRKSMSAPRSNLDSSTLAY